MLSKDITPSSIDGVKRLAKRLKKTEEVPYHEALNKAARAANFVNYAHARSKLKRSSRQNAAPHKVFLTVYWEDRKTRTHGRETLKAALSKPFLEICTKQEIKRISGLNWFRCVAADHLIVDSIIDGQHAASRLICEAIRRTRFMEAAGLKPATNSDLRSPVGKRRKGLPRCDHVSNWMDPTAGQFVMIDEPYLDAEVDDERRAWAERNGWHLEASTWPGMYFPYSCSLFIATDASKRFNFNALKEKIDGLPEPMTEDKWTGVSVNNHKVFVSPGATTPQDIRRAKAKGTIIRVSNRTTTPMSWRSTTGNRKPNAVMPFQIHQEIGRAIKSVLWRGNLGHAVRSRMDELRSELDNWMFVEHDERKFEGTNFLYVYYSEIHDDDPYLQLANSNHGKIQILESLMNLLKLHYPECAPLKRVLQRIEFSIKYLRKENLCASESVGAAFE